MTSNGALERIIESVQSYRQAKDHHKAKRLHAWICKQHLDAHPVVGNYLVPMLVDCGCLYEAQLAFDKLPHRNEHAWTSLISAYVDNSDFQYAFHLYHEMQELKCAQPNNYTYLVLLNACVAVREMEQGHIIHSEIVKRGLEQDILSGSGAIGNSLVNMYCKCSLLVDARAVFDKLCARTVVSWTVLVAGYADNGLEEEILSCFEQMEQEGVFLDSVLFVCSLKACATMCALGIGLKIHCEAIKRGVDKELKVGSTLVTMYTKCGLFVEAQNVFDKQFDRDVVSWAALVGGYAEHGLHEKVLDCFTQMQLDGTPPDAFVFAWSLKACAAATARERGLELHAEICKRGLEYELFVGSTLVDMYVKCKSLIDAQKVFIGLFAHDAISWNTLVAGYAEEGLCEELFDCLHQMQQEGSCPDFVTFVCGLKACGVSKGLNKGRKIHAEVIKRGLEGVLPVANTLIDVYAECGFFMDGQDIFEKLPDRNIASWTVMIKAYGDNHEGLRAVQCFENMRKAGLRPDSVAFASLLAACSHCSLVYEGQKYFMVMEKEHEIGAYLDLCACMVDLFARSGQIYEAERLVVAMNSSPSNVIISAFLGACRAYGEVEVSHRCFVHVVKVIEANVPTFLPVDWLMQTE